MLLVIRRVLQLRLYITDLWEEENALWRREAKGFGESKRSKKKEPNWPLVFCGDAELTDEDWQIITATCKVLEDLEDALMKLQGDGKLKLRNDGFVEAYGFMWDYAIAFDFFFNNWKHGGVWPTYLLILCTLRITLITPGRSLTSIIESLLKRLFITLLLRFIRHIDGNSLRRPGRESRSGFIMQKRLYRRFGIMNITRLIVRHRQLS